MNDLLDQVVELVDVQRTLHLRGRRHGERRGTDAGGPHDGPAVAPGTLQERVAAGEGGDVRAVPGLAGLVVVERGRSGSLKRTEVFETLLKPLVNARSPARFRF